MQWTIKELHPTFGAEIVGVDLSEVHAPEELAALRAKMEEYAVLVFRDQPLSDAEQVAFAQRLDGRLHRKTGASALRKNRFGDEAIADISNVDDAGKLLDSDDRRR
ncbi:MAG: TauD/TfdA family dioxygenase, partial [Gammaproteobacteria bacterium]|nr:TauD/TfdA family dioxygenase [Gammaproteobacteria bacterium]